MAGLVVYHHNLKLKTQKYVNKVRKGELKILKLRIEKEIFH